MSNPQRPRLASTERAIVRLLQEDGRLSTAEIARRLGVSEPTIRKKLNQLLESSTIRVRAVADPVALGYEAAAYVGVDVERSAIPEVAAVLAAFPFVESVAVTSGPYDIIIKACFETLSDLYEFLLVELATVEGIKDTHSFMILHNEKNDGLIGVAERD